MTRKCRSSPIGPTAIRCPRAARRDSRTSSSTSCSPAPARPLRSRARGGLLQTLTKRLIERAMDAELTGHLGYERGGASPGGVGNSRNGTTAKTLHTEHGSVRIETPRDRAGSFEPQIVEKHQRRFDGFDEKIVAMYGRGLTVRDIQAHLAEIYGVKVGHDLISRVTDAVLEDVKAWQARPLEDVYPVLYLDALVVKIRDGGTVRRKACYVVMGDNLDGERDVLGLWV